MPRNFLAPDEARAMLEWRDRRNAELRAKAPPGCADFYARLFPPLSDEIFRLAMEKALLGELPDPRELPWLDDDHLHQKGCPNISPEHPKWNQRAPRPRRGRRG